MKTTLSPAEKKFKKWADKQGRMWRGIVLKAINELDAPIADKKRLKELWGEASKTIKAKGKPVITSTGGAMK